MSFLSETEVIHRFTRRLSRSFHTATIAAVLLLVASSQLSAARGSDVYEKWVLVDTELNKMVIMNGLKPVKSFENIAIGRGGASVDRSAGDKSTPLGTFKIAWIKDSNRYHKFLGISYPSLQDAKVALENNRISTNTFNRIKKALDEGKLPPQDTELGGNLGIHGIGSSDRSIHDSFNWTNGCIAMTDEQLDELSKSVRIGTPIIIR